MVGSYLGSREAMSQTAVHAGKPVLGILANAKALSGAETSGHMVDVRLEPTEAEPNIPEPCFGSCLLPCSLCGGFGCRRGEKAGGSYFCVVCFRVTDTYLNILPIIAKIFAVNGKPPDMFRIVIYT